MTPNGPQNDRFWFGFGSESVPVPLVPGTDTEPKLAQNTEWNGNRLGTESEQSRPCYSVMLRVRVGSCSFASPVFRFLGDEAPLAPPI